VLVVQSDAFAGAAVSQVLTIDRARLTTRVGRLPSRVLAQMDEGLRLALAL
jgi:mRNA-degrading endonuclease toxin of MazEF toxin-antitoxin module